MSATTTTNKAATCAPGVNTGSTTCMASPSRASSSTILWYSDGENWSGKVRYSNTAPRFPVVINKNPSVYRRLRGDFLAQPARTRAHARAHVRTRHARSPTRGHHGAFSPSLDYHKG